MIALILLALLGSQALQTGQPGPVGDDVLVIGERLRNWRGRIGHSSRLPMRCRTVQSTGDPEIDRIGCDSLVACFTEMQPRLAVVGDRRQPKALRDSLLAAVEHDLGTCLESRHDSLVAELAETRFQARQGN